MNSRRASQFKLQFPHDKTLAIFSIITSLALVMPFFEGSKNFNINGGEMNDVGGNLVKNTTSNTTYNTDSFNASTGSKISKGDKVSQNINIGICLSGLIIMLFRVV